MKSGRSGAHSGRTRAGSISRRPQYRIDTRTSSGVLVRDRMFLMLKRMGERVASAMRPERKDSDAILVHR